MKTRSGERTPFCTAAKRKPLVGLLAAAMAMLAAAPQTAIAAEGDQAIVASLNPPPSGMPCTAAAAATSVYFQFSNPPFQVKQLSVYLDGKGVAQDAID